MLNWLNRLLRRLGVITHDQYLTLLHLVQSQTAKSDWLMNKVDAIQRQQNLTYERMIAMASNVDTLLTEVQNLKAKVTAVDALCDQIFDKLSTIPTDDPRVAAAVADIQALESQIDATIARDTPPTP
jgi:hypothetical protein